MSNHNGASLGPQWRRIHLPVQETWLRSLGWEDSLEKEMAIHSSILAWEIPQTEEPGGLQSVGLQIELLQSAFLNLCFLTVASILQTVCL